MAAEGEDITLTEEQRDRAAKWIQKHVKTAEGGDYHCPVCKNDLWNVGPHIVCLHTYNPNGFLSFGSSTYPHFQLICNTCGSTQLINAIVSGVLQQTPLPSPAKEEKSSG